MPYVVTNGLTPAFPISSGVRSVLPKIEQISSVLRTPLAISSINAVLSLLSVADIESQPLQACINSIFLTMTGFRLSNTHQILNLILFFVSFHKNFSHVTVKSTKVYICVFCKYSNVIFFIFKVLSCLNNWCVSIFLTADNCFHLP